MHAPVHFSQQNACHTDFPDDHFDLVYSIIVTHECPVPVLRSGGIMLHDGYFDPPPISFVGAVKSAAAS